MALVDDLALDLVCGPANRLSLPEHRQIELYSKRTALTVATPDGSAAVPRGEIAGVCRAFCAFGVVLRRPGAAAGDVASWAFCRSLPRKTSFERLLAELYRVLRLTFVVATDPAGRVGFRDGVFDFDGIVDRTVLAMRITPAGLRLAESAIAYFLEVRRQSYPAAYAEAMLTEYYLELLDEIRSFSDENRGLYQLRRQFPFNRHIRLDCDNPKVRVRDGMLEVEIGAARRDPARFPIDFFVVFDGALHIVPVEALADGGLPLADLPTWRARGGDPSRLPAEFEARFAHELVAVNQPMT